MAKVKIELGKREDVELLYSFPNNPSEVILPRHTLSDTIKHYLGHSLRRDGFKAKVEEVRDSGGEVIVTIDGDGADKYKTTLPSYLKAGGLGLQGARRLKKEASKLLEEHPVRLADAVRPDGPKIWRYNWRFFLPHGVPMVEHHAVQLLHFPPDSVLLRDRDYLAAATTKRWAQLLVENGAESHQTDQFQNIIDIAPIAAPHKDGKLLDGSYSFFTEYIMELLKLWLPEGEKRPIVAFGKPVKEWVEWKFNVKFGRKVPALQTIKLSGREVPTLRANHPSFIWAAMQYERDNPFTPQDEPLAKAMKIMKEDAIAAYWQVNMVKEPDKDPKTTLSEGEEYWAGKEQKLAYLCYTQVWSKPPAVAKCLASAISPDEAKSFIGAVGNEEIDALREIIGADEASVEPEELAPWDLRVA